MLYAIQIGDDGPIKIGRAKDPRGRLRGLQTGNPFKLRLLAQCQWNDKNEPLIHEALKDFKSNGEWFHPAEEVERVVSFMASDAFEECMSVVAKDRRYYPRKFNRNDYQKVYMRSYRKKQALMLQTAKALLDGSAEPWPK